jgi:hypothetical protein
MLLTLIAIFLIDSTLGKAFDSQRNNKDIFRNNSRGKQRAKEMLQNNHANFCTIPLKSETHDTTSHTGIKPPLRSLGLSGFSDKTTGLFQSMDYVPTFPTGIEPLSLSSSSNKTNGLSQNEDSVPNDNSALIILQICIPMTTASTGMKADNDRYSSLNEVTAPQAFSATTATMTATMTQVLAKTTAITKAIENKLVECFLHPTKSSANNATNKVKVLCFMLFLAQQF